MSTRPALRGERFYARSFALVALGLLGFMTYLVLRPMFSALAWAAFIAFLLHPVHVWLTRLLRGRASISSGLLTLATVLVVLGPLTGLAAAFATQVDQLLELAQQVRRMGADGAFNWVPETLRESIGVSQTQLREWLGEGAKTMLQAAAAQSGKVFVGAVGTVLSFTIAMFVLFFLLRDGAHMLVTVRGLIPLSGPDKNRLLDHLGSVIHALIYGQVLTALIQGALVGIGFAVLGLPAPVVFGVLATVLALLPLVGTPVVWVPAVIVLAAQGRWISAILLTVWGVFVSVIDNVLRPVLVAGRARIRAVTVFIGVIGGVAAFGAVGLILGPVVLSLGTALARFTLETRQSQS